MKLYKLTDSQGYTHNKHCKWGKGKTNSVAEKDRGTELCSSQVIHAYTNPNLALLLNPIHAGYDNPRLYEADGEIKTQDWGKVGVWELTTTKRLRLPDWYAVARQKVGVQFAILCDQSVLAQYENEHPDDDRPKKAREAAREYLKYPSAEDRFDAYAAYIAACAVDAAYAARVVYAVELDFAQMADKAVKLTMEE